MTEDKKAEAAAAAPPPAAESFPVERLIAEAPEFLGYASHEAAGALAGSKSTLTIAEARELTKKWLKAPVGG